MENSFIELTQFNQNNSEKYMNFYQDFLDFSDISCINRSNFLNFKFLCKFCQKIPKIEFIKNSKIKFICECEISPREVPVNRIFEYLHNSSENNINISGILKCHMHKDEKYILYCKKCNINLCFKCSNEFFEQHDKHNQDLIAFAFDKKTKSKIKYIIQKFEEKNQCCIDNDSKIDFENEINDNNKLKLIPIKSKENSDESNIDDKENIINNTSNGKNYLTIKNETNNLNYNEEEKAEIISIINENNNEELFEEEYFYKNLIYLIIDDYINYPNFSHIETISNIEKFIILYSGDCYEINLKYEFEEKDIKNNTLELFGGTFVKNNEENFFLIINEKIMDLSRTINLSNIYYNNYELENLPFKLNVKLIEKKNKIINDLSFMFSEISTLIYSSELNNLNTTKVTKMNNLFHNCSSIKQLPNISEFDTSNVIDMSYMFYNCSLITELPDISKWDMKNVKDISHMFQNCESLSSLPDISKWDVKNIETVEEMFNNCKSLSNLPNISNWKITNEEEINNLFKGCELLELNLQKTNNSYFKIFNCLNIINKICKPFITYIFLILFFLFLISIINIYPIDSILASFNLDNANKLIFQTRELSKITNSIVIAELMNTTNIEEIKEKKEYYLNLIINSKIINYNEIKNKIKSGQNYMKKNNIIHLIISLIKTIIFILLYYAKSLKFISLNIIFFQIIALVIIIITMILCILDYFIIVSKLLDNFNFLFLKFEKIFKIIISQDIKEEIKGLNSCLKDAWIFLIISFIIAIVFGIDLKNNIEFKITLKNYKNIL